MVSITLPRNIPHDGTVFLAGDSTTLQFRQPHAAVQRRRVQCRVRSSAVKRSIGSATGFHNHGEGPYYGLLLVESAY